MAVPTAPLLPLITQMQLITFANHKWQCCALRECVRTVRGDDGHGVLVLELDAVIVAVELEVGGGHNTPPHPQTRRHAAPFLPCHCLRDSNRSGERGGNMATAAVTLALGLASSSTAPMPKVTRDLRAFWPFQEPTGSPKIDSVHGCVKRAS
jgi:hypothetical protein